MLTCLWRFFQILVSSAQDPRSENLTSSSISMSMIRKSSGPRTDLLSASMVTQRASSESASIQHLSCAVNIILFSTLLNPSQQVRKKSLPQAWRQQGYPGCLKNVTRFAVLAQGKKKTLGYAETDWLYLLVFLTNARRIDMLVLICRKSQRLPTYLQCIMSETKKPWLL